MPEFIPGRELSRHFYHEAVRPMLDSKFPGLEHTACLIGTGSDVLGYDTFESTDQEWGPRLQLFLSQDDWGNRADDIDDLRSAELPRRFRDFSTNFSEQDEEGVRSLVDTEDGPIRHGVRVGTFDQFFKSSLRIDPFGKITPIEWLTFFEQSLLEVARAAVYHDDFGLAEVQARFPYYPHDVWLYLVATMHNSLGITEPLSIEVRPFHGRPYLVSGAGRFERAISRQFIDPEVQALPAFLGSVDQISHSVDRLTAPHRREVLQGLYKLP